MSLLKYITEMSQVNDEIFKLDADEYQRMADLFDEVGADISAITVGEVSENSIVGMSDKDRFKKDYAVRIRRNVYQSLREMIDVGLESKDWYNEIYHSIFSSLNESDGCLFLLLLASTSPRNPLERNFVEASALFEGFKLDIEHNEELINEFTYDTFKANEFLYDVSNKYGYKYQDLYILKALEDKNILGLSSKILNIQKSFQFFMESDGNLNKNKTAEYLIAKFNPYSKTLTGLVDFSGKALSKYKVYNFAMNLLRPDAVVSIRNKQWYFVTIDTWMLQAMYPYIDKDDRERIGSHGARYLYAQEKIIQFANEVGLMPHQVQASIWVAKMTEGENNEIKVDSFTKVIEKKKQELISANDYFEELNNDVQTVIRNIHLQGKLKTEPENEPTELAKELGDTDDVPW